MRILEVAGSGTIATGRMGPVSTVIQELSTELRAIGHDVVIADAKSGDRATNLPIIELDVPARDGRDAWRKERVLAAELLKCDLGRYDVIHTHEWPVAHFLLRHGVRTVYTAHTPIWSSYRGLRHVRDRALRSIRPHEYQVIQRSRLTVALGHYLQVPGAKIVVIPSGIRVEDWTCPPKTRGTFTILFIGRIVPVKGAHVLVEALRRLRFEYRAVFVGPPAEHSRDPRDATRYARRLAARAREMPVTFTGFLPNSSGEFRDQVASAHLLVVPSLFDAQGLVVLEAFSMGLPVIASDVGGLPMMVNPSVGRLVRPADPAALATAISELHDEPRQLEAMASAARPYVVQNFSWRICAMAHSAAMEECVRA